MKKVFNLKCMSEIAIFAAIGFVLDFLQGVISDIIPFFPQGGSIGIAMIAVFVMAYRNGFLAGFLTGLLMGILDLMDGFYAISDTWYKVIIQVGFDYLISYAMCGFAGLLKRFVNKYKDNNFKAIMIISLGCFIGSFLKFMCHFLSGVIFFPSESKNKYIYSLIYNGSFMLPSFILTTIILVLIFIKQKKFFESEF